MGKRPSSRYRRTVDSDRPLRRTNSSGDRNACSALVTGVVWAVADDIDQAVQTYRPGLRLPAKGDPRMDSTLFLFSDNVGAISWDHVSATRRTARTMVPDCTVLEISHCSTISYAQPHGGKYFSCRLHHLSPSDRWSGSVRGGCFSTRPWAGRGPSCSRPCTNSGKATPHDSGTAEEPRSGCGQPNRTATGKPS